MSLFVSNSREGLLSKQTSNECLGGQSEFVHSGVSVGLPRAEDRAGKIGLQ